MDLNPQNYVDLAIEMLMQFGPKLLLAIVTLFVGLKGIKILNKIVDKALRFQKVDVSLRGFIESLVSIGLKLLLVVSVASMVGVATTSFVAIIGAAGLAVGLALQGSLANFAGGVLILLFKPFKVGNVIEAAGHTGKVKQIQIFSTILNTPDNKKVVIPNGVLSNGSIVNYSAEKKRRVDLVFGISYDDDIKKAKQVLEAIAKKDERILADPEPQIVVTELGASSVDIACRVWVKTADYWLVYFAMQEMVKLEFDKAGLSFPFPQREIHLVNESS